MKKPIRPIKSKCPCGAKVLNHHFLCDKCWGKKEKARYYRERKKLLRPLIKKLKGK